VSKRVATAAQPCPIGTVFEIGGGADIGASTCPPFFLTTPSASEVSRSICGAAEKPCSRLTGPWDTQPEASPCSTSISCLITTAGYVPLAPIPSGLRLRWLS